MYKNFYAKKFQNIELPCYYTYAFNLSFISRTVILMHFAFFPSKVAARTCDACMVANRYAYFSTKIKNFI